MIKDSCKTCSVGVPPGPGLGTTAISNKINCSFFNSKNYKFYIALEYLMSYYIYYRFSPYIATELPIYQLHFTVTFVQFLTKHLHLNFFLTLKKSYVTFHS